MGAWWNACGFSDLMASYDTAPEFIRYAVPSFRAGI